MAIDCFLSAVPDKRKVHLKVGKLHGRRRLSSHWTRQLLIKNPKYENIYIYISKWEKENRSIGRARAATFDAGELSEARQTELSEAQPSQ